MATYPTVEERESIVYRHSGKVDEVDFDQGKSQSFGPDNLRADVFSIRVDGKLYAFVCHETKRKYLLAKQIQVGEKVVVGLNEFGMLMEVERV